MIENKIDWCPTQSGTFTAYDPEYRFGKDEWKVVPSVFDNNPHGVPFPRLDGGIAMTIGLMGKAQAHAVAWGFAAQAAMQGQTMEIRVHPYTVIYDIKARKWSEEEIEVAAKEPRFSGNNGK